MGLMSLDEIFNAFGLAGVLMYFLSPTIVFILLFYKLANRHKRKSKIKRAKQIKDKEASKYIDDEPLIPKGIEKYRNLELHFDKNGHIK